MLTPKTATATGLTTTQGAGVPPPAQTVAVGVAVPCIGTCGGAPGQPATGSSPGRAGVAARLGAPSTPSPARAPSTTSSQNMLRLFMMWVPLGGGARRPRINTPSAGSWAAGD